MAGGLVASLRRSIGRQIDMFEERLKTVVEGICSFQGFEKIVHLAEQTKLSMNNRSLRLQAVLGEGLPRWEDFALPSYEDIREVVRKLEDTLTAMASIRTRTNCEGHPIDLDATDAGEREEKAEEEGEEEVRERKKESTAVLPEVKEEFAYKKEGRSHTQNSERQIPGEQ